MCSNVLPDFQGHHHVWTGLFATVQTTSSPCLDRIVCYRIKVLTTPTQSIWENWVRACLLIPYAYVTAELPVIIFLTKIDEVEPGLIADLGKTFHSEKLYKLVQVRKSHLGHVISENFRMETSRGQHIDRNTCRVEGASASLYRCECFWWTCECFWRTWNWDYPCCGSAIDHHYSYKV